MQPYNIKASTDLDTMKRLVEGLKNLPKCNGKETHEHYRIADDVIVTHTHAHTVHNEVDFNRLHHHAPNEHDKIDPDILATTETVFNVPF